MDHKDMVIIDFSNGIRSEEIQHNFDALEEQVSRERLAIAGYGISYGLKFSINGFNVNMEDGAIVDKTGKEMFYDAQSMNISLPELIEWKSRVTTVDQYGQIIFNDGNGHIRLMDIPYAANRLTTADNVDVSQSGVSVKDADNANMIIPIVSIQKNIIHVDSKWAGRKVSVQYKYAFNRYDTIYIDEDYTVKVAEGLSSSTPGYYIPPQNKYILGFIKVDAHHLSTDGKTYAAILVEKDLKYLRNMYTDENNQLYICGVPFKDLQIIQMIRPEAPVENTIYYDAESNKLRIWKTVDGVSDWVCVNDTSILPVLEYKIWTPEENPSDIQNFIFNSSSDLNMKFIPNKNEVEIYISQIPLHSDQFDEITLTDAQTDLVLRDLLISEYGYTAVDIDDANVKYEDIGIGFKLAKPLDKAQFVEARITHRVNENPVCPRFQRSATFIARDSFPCTNGAVKEYITNAPYKYGENQLEVYINGSLLSPGTDYSEGSDIASPVKGMNTNKFKINDAYSLFEGDMISYKIMTNVYSYDHLYLVMSETMAKVDAADQAVKQTAAEMETFVNNTNSQLNTMKTAVDNVVSAEAEHASFVKKADVLNIENMPAQVVAGISKGIINTSIVKVSGTSQALSEISPEDFIMMFDINGLGGNSILRRDADYSIVKDDTSETVYIQYLMADPAAFDGHTIYITGIKLS
jgi:hypothetical protein